MMHAIFADPIVAARNLSLRDSEIIEEIKRGKPNAFEIIMRRYNQRLYRIARSILKNEAEAEDSVQDAYIKAYTLLDSFIGPQGFSAWLTKITVNEALMRLRKTKRIATYGFIENLPESTDEIVSPMPNPERLAANHQFRQLLEKAIDALPDDFRTVFVLRAVEQLSTQETADYLDLKVATVKTRLHRAKKLLQQQLNTAIDKALFTTYQFAGNRCDHIVNRVLQKIKHAKTV